MVKELGDLLDAQFSWLTLPSNTVGSTPGSLFLQELPDGGQDDAVAIYQYGGEDNEEALGNNALYEKPRLQVLVRAVKLEDAFSRSYLIMKFLRTQASVTIGGVRYLKIRPLGTPAEIGPDPQDRQRVSLNYSVWKEFSPDPP